MLRTGRIARRGRLSTVTGRAIRRGGSVARMKRRTFLTLTGGAAGAAVIAGPWIRRSRAATFGAFPTGTQAVQLPENVRAKRVLEVFLYGGVSTWETFYFVRDYGTASDMQYPNTQYYAYATSNANAI